MTHVPIGAIESPPCGTLYDFVELDVAQVVADTQALEGQEIAPVGGRLRSTVSRNSTRSTHRALPVLVAAARSRGTHIPLLVWGAEMFLCGNTCQLETVGTY